MLFMRVLIEKILRGPKSGQRVSHELAHKACRGFCISPPLIPCCLGETTDTTVSFSITHLQGFPRRAFCRRLSSRAVGGATEGLHATPSVVTHRIMSEEQILF